MDLKDTFQECVQIASSTSVKLGSYRAPSVFLIKADKLRLNLSQLAEFCLETFDEYSAFHQDLTRIQPTIDLVKFDDATSRLLVDAAIEIKELQGMKLKLLNKLHNEQWNTHYSAVVSSLCEQLQSISRLLDLMKQERQKYNKSCYRIHTEITDDVTLHRQISESVKSDIVEKADDFAQKVKFSERYESEIANPKQMKQYKDFFEEHKELLVLENKELHEKFSEELAEAQSIEKSVQSIAYLLSDFTRILEQQNENIEDVHTDSKATSAFVHGADEQLLLTIERSKSSQRNMVIVTIGLSILLLLLDYLTP